MKVCDLCSVVWSCRPAKIYFSVGVKVSVFMHIIFLSHSELIVNINFYIFIFFKKLDVTKVTRGKVFALDIHMRMLLFLIVNIICDFGSFLYIMIFAYHYVVITLLWLCHF